MCRDWRGSVSLPLESYSPDRIFRQLLDAETSTLTYLLADPDTREALLIDCVFEQHLRDLALIRELDLVLRYTLETHVHADHVTGAWLMKQALGSRIALSADAGAEGADRLLAHGDVVGAGSLRLEVRATAGHTNGCLSYVLAGHSLAFTGDALLIRGAGRTDFQQGSAQKLFRSVREQLFTLPGECRLYPGHDYSGRTMTTVAEERAHNPRLGDGVREQDFVAYMDNLGLPHPARMERAVPANLECGRPEDPDSAPHAPDWGPVIRTYAGVWQIEPEWVYGHAGEVCVVDVREQEEVDASPMGLVPGSLVIPLSQLRARTGEVARDRPVVCVCPAGARSAVAGASSRRPACQRWRTCAAASSPGARPGCRSSCRRPGPGADAGSGRRQRACQRACRPRLRAAPSTSRPSNAAGASCCPSTGRRAAAAPRCGSRSCG